VIVLDTHAWLWWVDAPRKLSRAANRAIDRADRIGVCTVSVLELVGLAERRRIRLKTPTRTWVANALGRDRVEPLPLMTDVAVDAAELRFVRDPIDRIIYATARAADAQLVTRDERLRRFDPERILW
jgi:PIN domain nuclease of toxin-antitoxin system